MNIHLHIHVCLCTCTCMYMYIIISIKSVSYNSHYNFWLLPNYNKTGKPVYEDLETSNKINGITNMIGYQ